MEEIERARRPPPLRPATALAAAAAMFSVLGDDDLLLQILLRLVLPTSLLRAALVCKRWYRLASDPTFLRHFRDRHPPRCLGFYISTSGRPLPRFFPLRPLPELAAAARRAGSFFDAFVGSSASVTDSRGSRLSVRTVGAGSDDITYQVCSPLSSAENAVVVLPDLRHLPEPPSDDIMLRIPCTFLTDGSDVRSILSYVFMRVRKLEKQAAVFLYELRDMCWVATASMVAHIPLPEFGIALDTLLDGSKFYLLDSSNKIRVCDFPSSSISTIDLPNGVKCTSLYIMLLRREGCNIRLSRRDDSGFYLLHVKGSLLHVFHGEDAGNWFLVHSVCLRDVCKNLGIADWPSLDGHTNVAKIKGVGDNAKFVVLGMLGIVVFLDITTKQAEKLYEMAPEDGTLDSVRPLMLIWPPTFPELEGGFDQQD